jgi:hypothetical protein
VKLERVLITVPIGPRAYDLTRGEQCRGLGVKDLALLVERKSEAHGIGDSVRRRIDGIVRSKEDAVDPDRARAPYELVLVR